MNFRNLEACVSRLIAALDLIGGRVSESMNALADVREILSKLQHYKEIRTGKLPVTPGDIAAAEYELRKFLLKD